MAGALAMDEADVVVVGAGAFGLSAAYHLAALGAGLVVVLDRFAPASQASPRAAGLFKLVQADETLTRLAALSAAIVEGFEGETGVPMPCVRSGRVLVARTQAHAALIRLEAAACRGWGVDLEVVDGEGVRRLASYLTGEDVVVGCHIPGDVSVEEPTTLPSAYRTAGERPGVVVVGEAPVTGLRTRARRIEGVVDAGGGVGGGDRGAGRGAGAGGAGAAPAFEYRADRRDRADGADRADRRRGRLRPAGAGGADGWRFRSEPAAAGPAAGGPGFFDGSAAAGSAGRGGGSSRRSESKCRTWSGHPWSSIAAACSR